jgi:predicted nucleotidyltransferase
MPILGYIIPNMGKRQSERKSASLADALFSSTQQKVLGLFFGQPDREFTISELIDLLGAGSGAVQREILKLTSSGLVEVKQLGRQKFFRTNKSSPIFDELQSIMRKTTGLEEPIRNALLKISSKIELALIYGSIANKSDSATSDIDLLVVANGLTLTKLFEALTLVERKLSRPINPTLYSVKEFQEKLAAKNAFLRKILAGRSIYLIGENPNAD